MNRYHERNNPFDRFAIKCCEIGKKVTTSHIPIEISTVTKFFIDRGATITGLQNYSNDTWNGFKFSLHGKI